MLKKLVTTIVLACLALSMAGSAFADFADSRLIRVYYDRNGNEIATDLGDVKGVIAAGTTTINGSFGSLAANATTFAVYFALERPVGVNQLWASGKTNATSTIVGGATGLTSLKSGTGSMYALYMDNNPNGTDYTGSASATSSYKNKLSATPGWLANSVNAASRLNTEASLASVIGAGSGSISQILYFWNNAVTTDADEKIGVPVATITTNSDGSTVISTTKPSPPTIGTASRGNAEATVTFSAPLFNGGSVITGYTVTSSDGTKTASGDGSPIVVTGLANGTAYTFTVTASNANGTGPASAPSNSVTPGSPDAPTGVTAEPGDGRVTVSFAPANPNGGAVTSYTVRSSDGKTASGTGSPITLTGLENGTAYTFTVTATNAHGTGAASEASASVTPTKPGALLPQTIAAITFTPETLLVGAATTASATGGDSGNAVTFSSTTPEVCSVSGSTVTGLSAGTCIVAADQAGDAVYSAATQVTQEIAVVKATQTIGAISFAPATLKVAGSTTASADGGASGNAVTFSTSTATVCSVSGGTVTGLAAGTCTIVANQTGNDLFDPAAPVSRNLTVDRASQTILSFTLTPDSVAVGGSTTASATASSNLPVTFSSATPAACSESGPNGSTITLHNTDTCTVTASQAGDENYEAASQTLNITAGRAAQTITFGAATAVKVGGTATLSASASSGLPVGFSSSTPAVCSVSGSTVTGISAGSCTIAASQTGDASYNAAAPVTQQITVEMTSQSIGAISFAPPTLAVAGVTTASATASSGLAVNFSSTTPAVCSVSGSTVTGITAGTCSIAAVQAGNTIYSAASQVSREITVSAILPGAPTAVSVTPGNSQATVSFNAPASNGGSAITGYTVTSTPGGFTATGASGPIIVTGLENGTLYSFTVAAANVAGTGPQSAASESVTPATLPGAPAIGSATAGNALATVSFSAPAADGGSPVASYTVTSFPGGFTATGAASPITVTGLTNGTPYTFTVTAANTVGAGPASAASNSATPAVPLVSFSVSPTAGANGAIAPAAIQTVAAGATTSFTVTPNDDYQISTVTGCGGTLSGNIYTTAGMINNCQVSASFIAVPALKGDLDGSGKIDVADALLALQFAVGSKTQSAKDLAVGDVAPIENGISAPDNRLDIADAVAILRRSVGQLSW